MKFLWFILFFVTTTTKSPSVAGVAKKETFSLHLKVEARYRCYSGYDSKGKSKSTSYDQFTKKICDNKESQKVLFDGVIPVEIKQENTPSGVEFSGGWQKDFGFMDRKFFVGINFFKQKREKPIKVGLYGYDDEPSNRRTDIYLVTKSPEEMNSLKLIHHSIGRKEEVELVVLMESKKQQ